jgi:hypothetical protein
MQVIGHQTSVESRAIYEARWKRTSVGIARSQVEAEGESYKDQRGRDETRCRYRRRGR